MSVDTVQNNTTLQYRTPECRPRLFTLEIYLSARWLGRIGKPVPTALRRLRG